MITENSVKIKRWLECNIPAEKWSLIESQKTSRNTHTYIYRGHDKILIARVNRSSTLEELNIEMETLNKVSVLFNDESIKIAEPIGICHDPLALIMIKEEGELLTNLILLFLKDNGTMENLINHIIALSGSALANIHASWKCVDGTVRQFLDFSPKNLLVNENNQTFKIVLIDLPEVVKYGSRWDDVGTFTFELSRTAAKGIGFKALFDERVINMKSAFVKSYCDKNRIEYNREVWEKVIHGEKKRVNQVLKFYSKFWKQEKWMIEMFRGIIYGTFIFIYKIFGLYILKKIILKAINNA